MLVVVRLQLEAVVVGDVVEVDEEVEEVVMQTCCCKGTRCWLEEKGFWSCRRRLMR